MTTANWARLLLVVVVALVAQVAVLDNVTLLGAHPDVMVLIAAAAGIAQGSGRGAIAGFVAGVAADLVVTMPFGLSALTFTLIGFGTGLLRPTLVARDVDSPQVAACIGAAAVATILYAIIGTIAGKHGLIGAATAEAVLSVTLGAVVLSYPVLRITRWAFSGTRTEIGLSVPPGGSAMS
ncbi:MAG: rod shape-determining protein MreD [Acidimicrobiales bacterium]